MWFSGGGQESHLARMVFGIAWLWISCFPRRLSVDVVPGLQGLAERVIWTKGPWVRNKICRCLVTSCQTVKITEGEPTEVNKPAELDPTTRKRNLDGDTDP
ncbi:hypothetical protein B0T13DRAFT_193657 [Neurospora crassa]|nr:hypothetical protein B0T13DRAFT_193657 [Neurospora crassa]